MTDKSFIRFGGFAGILLALTSWASVVAYLIFVPAAQQLTASNVQALLESLAQNSFGIQLFYGLYALIAVWAVVGIVALYYRLRAAGEAWAFFAMLIGVSASFLTIVSALQQLAFFRYLAAVYPTAQGAALFAYAAPVPLNPLNATTQGLTAPWFLISAILMLRTDLPKPLAYLGLVAFADLAIGFLASLFGLSLVAGGTAFIAGAVGGPVFWLWLGLLLRRGAESTRVQLTAPAPAE